MMHLNKLKMSDVLSFDAKQSIDVEKDIRKQIGELRIDLYGNRGTASAKARGLKKSLARILTARRLASKTK